MNDQFEKYSTTLLKCRRCGKLLHKRGHAFHDCNVDIVRRRINERMKKEMKGD